MEEIAFRAFVVFGVLSFFLSSAAVYLQFYTVGVFTMRVKSTITTTLLIVFAIGGMMLAFVLGFTLC